MFFYSDLMVVKGDYIHVAGWASGDKPGGVVSYHVYCGKKEVKAELTRGLRPDVACAIFGDPALGEVGYFLRIPRKKFKLYRIVAKEYVNGELCEEKSMLISAMVIRLRNFYHKAKTGFLNFWTDFTDKANHFIKWKNRKYARFFENMRVSPFELSKERKTIFTYQPLISFIIPMWNTPVPYIRELLDSILNQTYEKFEVCIVNASPENQEMADALAEFSMMDERIHVRELPENRGISENSNEALKMARGEFVAMVDHDDRIEADTLYQYVKRLNEKRETDLLYCDEDKITDKSYDYFYPNFKPDWNEDMLYSNNYICHMLMVRKTLMDNLGGFRSEFDSAQDYDLILRITERTHRIEHIPKVLYHWRTAKNSTAAGVKHKSNASDAGARALNEHFKQMGWTAQAIPYKVPGWYKTKFRMMDEPLVSVLIPNKDHSEDLDICIRSILEDCTYKNIEILIIENNSTEEETFNYYKKIEKEFSNVRILYYKGSFNYSDINNFGFKEAKGEYILLLNNDTEVISKNLFESMLGYFTRPQVGIVGARLLFDDGTIQHAGVLIGGGGLADHYLKGKSGKKPHYMCRAVCANDVSCVTAACLMVRRSVYEEVGMLDTDLIVAFNDVDFCLKVRNKGYLVVYDPDAELYHYESKSRGVENTPEKYMRFGGESYLLSSRYQINDTFFDPYYNRNMSTIHNFEPDFLLQEKRRLEVGKEYADRISDIPAFAKFSFPKLSLKRKLKYWIKSKTVLKREALLNQMKEEK